MRWSQDGKQHRARTGETNWKAALKKAADLEKHLTGEVSVRRTGDDDRIEVKIAKFLVGKEGAQRTRSTMVKYELQLPRFAAFMASRGKFSVSEITLDDLTDYRATWPAIYPSKLTRKMVQTRLKGFLKRAGVDRNVLDNLEPIEVKQNEMPPPKPFSEEEIKRLLEQVPLTFTNARKASRVTALIHLALSTGLAIHDCVQLERSNIRGNWLETVRQKTKKEVKVPLSPALVTELRAVLNGNERFVVFEGPVTIENAVWLWMHDLRKLMKGAGVYVKGDLSHRFRDSFVDYHYGQGTSLSKIAAMLGDSEVTVERHYKSLFGRLKSSLAGVAVREW